MWIKKKYVISMELLLEHLDKLPSGHLLDFGCGAGVLGAAVKRRTNPESEHLAANTSSDPPCGGERMISSNQ